jgi:precorrin-6B methylase 2
LIRQLIRVLPDPVRRLLKRTPLGRRWDGMTTRSVRFERLTFLFTAPRRTAHKAQHHGIENRICRTIMTRLSEGSVAIDVGSNFGFITLVMALSVGRTGHVHAFEMQEGIAAVLAHNIQQNELQPRCTVHCQEVGLTHRLDDLLASATRLDVIKVDTDGTDYDVLIGAERLLRKHRPLVVAEMSANQDAIINFLQTVGYRYLVGMQGEPVSEAPWPANVFASMQPIAIPPRGSLSPS